MRLAIAQMVLGMAIVGNYIASIAATSTAFTTDEGYRLIFFPWFNICFVLGLAVLGCGIAQLLRGLKGAKPL